MHFASRFFVLFVLIKVCCCGGGGLFLQIFVVSVFGYNLVNYQGWFLH